MSLWIGNGVQMMYFVFFSRQLKPFFYMLLLQNTAVVIYDTLCSVKQQKKVLRGFGGDHVELKWTDWAVLLK